MIFVSESQCAFRRNRGTIDIIFPVGKIKEKCREQNQSLYILFVHLTKAFDTVFWWVGRVVWMEDTHFPKMVLFSEVTSGERSIGHPLKRLKDSLKQKTESNPTLRYETFATDRNAWRMAVHKGF